MLDGTGSGLSGWFDFPGKFVQFSVIIHSLIFWPCLKEERAKSLRLPKTEELFFCGTSLVPTGSNTPVWRGRRKATDDRRIVYVSFWISFRDLQSVHPAKVISDNEWTPAAAAANKCLLVAIDAPRKRMPFQLSRQEMHRKFFDQILR